MKTILKTLTLSLALSSCSSTKENFRFSGFSAAGAIIGGGTAAALSPNKESRGLNALVFGLLGALTGAFISHETRDPNADTKAKSDTLRIRETTETEETKKYGVDLSKDELPAFVKERLSKLIIEEIPVKEQVEEDGSLHESHRAYRIKNEPELLTMPLNIERKKQ